MPSACATRTSASRGSTRAIAAARASPRVGMDRSIDRGHATVTVSGETLDTLRPLVSRKILSGLAPLRFGEGHDCTFAYALAVATKSEYDWIMGCSGAAFVTRIDVERWDP